MIKRLSSSLLFFLVAAGNLVAGNIELAPFYGYRFGGSLTSDQTGNTIEIEPAASVGLTASIALPSGREFVEALYSYQDTELSSRLLNQTIDVQIEEWQVGINREFPSYDDRLKPFLVGLLGVTNLDFSDNLGADTLFSLGMGGGVKYFPTKNIGLRLDLRGYISLVDGSGGIACAGGCVAHYQGSGFFQGEISPSLLIHF